MKIYIKPLSVNKCWQGKRYKTYDYIQYEKEMFALLSKRITIPKGKIEGYITFGLSNSLNDIDNSVKPFLDIMQKFYSFNDKDIYRIVIEKKIVEKGKEFIDFDFQKHLL